MFLTANIISLVGVLQDWTGDTTNLKHWISNIAAPVGILLLALSLFLMWFHKDEVDVDGIAIFCGISGVALCIVYGITAVSN